jgi:flagellar motor switch protein FliN/FliY
MPAAQLAPETQAAPQVKPAEAAIVATHRAAAEGENDAPALPPSMAHLPVQLNVAIPLPKFRVRDLLALTKGAVLETGWLPSDDVPLWCGKVQLVWLEFEVVDQDLAVRVTRLV